MKRFWFALLTLGLIFTSTITLADEAFVKRKQVRAFINQMVKKHHFNKKSLTQTMSNVKLQPKIITSMNHPYEKKTWDVYKKLFLTPKRVTQGVEFWEKNKALLQRAEKKYGVPANIIVAILGVETYYGRIQGNHRVIDALSTLAFDYPKRARFFKKELREFLILCREHKLNPLTIKGSYAGAIGKPQFMPSSYRHFAVDFSGSGRADLVNDNADVIASVANYFKRHGWKPYQAVTTPAELKGKKYRWVKIKAKKARYSVKRLKQLGVQAKDLPLNQPKRAGLIKLSKKGDAEYWIAYPNFYVITRYNSSEQYAMAVYLLAQQLKQRWAALHPPLRAYA